jgi:hypothetical protein
VSRSGHLIARIATSIERGAHDSHDFTLRFGSHTEGGAVTHRETVAARTQRRADAASANAAGDNADHNNATHVNAARANADRASTTRNNAASARAPTKPPRGNSAPKAFPEARP